MARVATVYVDGSLRSGEGGGYVARRGDVMEIGCFPVSADGNAILAEAEAAREAVDRVLEAFPGTEIVDLRVDNSVVAGVTPISRQTGVEVHAALDGLRAVCRMAGAGLQREWSRGHAGIATASGFANDMADALASLGAAGLDAAWRFPFDALWRHRLMACHPDLVRTSLVLTSEGAAAFLGVPVDTVELLLRHGHLRRCPERKGIAPGAAIAVRDKARAMGADVETPCRWPAPERLRGRVDEAGSGLRLHAPTVRGVRASLATQVSGGMIGAGWVVRSEGTLLSGGALLPQADLESQMAALPACVADAFSLRPDLDDLVMTMGEPWSVGTLNGETVPTDPEIGVLCDLDRLLSANEAEFRAELVRSERIPAVDRHARPALDVARAIALSHLAGRPVPPFRGEGPASSLRDLAAALASDIPATAA